MGFLDRSRPRDSTDEPTDDAESTAEVDAGSEQADGTTSGRRWLLLGGAVVVGVAVALVLRSKRRAAREARFTEIELDTVDGDSEPESEQSAE